MKSGKVKQKAAQLKRKDTANKRPGKVRIQRHDRAQREGESEKEGER